MCHIVGMATMEREPSLEVCRVLDEDADLAEAIPIERREQALRECLAVTVSVPVGRWRASQTPPPGEGIGLLVLRGLLIRRVGVDGRFGAELLGAGDLLRPWQGDGEPPTLPISTGWRVIEPARLALLDERFVRRLGRYPQLSGRLVGRALERSRNLAVNMAIVHQARVDVRLHMLFWHLAARWGRVRSDCVSLPLRLTHNVLADLTAARRPTVTSALSELAKRSLVHQEHDGWLLSGKPPGELLELLAAPRTLTAKTRAGERASAEARPGARDGFASIDRLAPSARGG
jgi:CRP/FNR family transcriptional regulator, cyclic AMP receptor protein